MTAPDPVAVMMDRKLQELADLQARQTQRVVAAKARLVEAEHWRERSFEEEDRQDVEAYVATVQLALAALDHDSSEQATEEQQLSDDLETVANDRPDTLTRNLATFGENVLRILESCDEWSADTLDAIATDAQLNDLADDSAPGVLFKAARDLGPSCGHSVCRQHYIETGSRECVASCGVISAPQA